MKNRTVLVMLSLLGSLLVLVACEKNDVPEKESVRPVKAMLVGEPQAFGGRWFPGKAEAAETVNLSFRVAGTLNDFPVLVGNRVKEGDLVARLDLRPFLLAVDEAEAGRKKAIADRNQAEADYQRVLRVYRKDPGAVSQSMVEKLASDFEGKKAQVESAAANLDTAKDNLGYAHLHAPFDGIIVEKFVENFEDVRSQQEILRLVDNSEIDFTVQVPETLMTYAEDVKKALVVFDAHPGVEVPGRIYEIGREASQTTRTYPVTVRLKQPDDFVILPGMAGKARGSRDEARELARERGEVGAQIPVSAITADAGGESSVWVIDEQTGQVSRKKVQVVNLTEEGAMVKGLDSGVWIATAGANTLVEGQQVRILK